MKLTTSVFVLIAFFLSTAASARPLALELDDDWSVVFDGQLRARLIVDSGRDLVDGKFAEREYVTQRARLGVTLAHTNGLGVTLRFQDVRLWGEEFHTLDDASANGFDVHEAFATLPVLEGLTLKLGRQEINSDNQRMIGAVGWTQRARSLDGARLSFVRDKLELDAFFALVAEQDQDPDGNVPDGRGPDTTVSGLHASMDPAKGHNVALAFYNASNTDSRAYRNSVGVITKGGVSAFTYTGEFYYQFGRLGDESVGALLAAGSAGYRLEVPTRPTATVWFEYLSGDGTPQGTFDTLFATNHKFYGEMDFFLAIPANTAALGLVDIGGRIALQPHDRIALNVDLHLMSGASADANGERNFGTEIDTKLKLEVMDKVALRILYGIFLPGEAMRTARGIAPGADLSVEHLIYATLDVKL